MNTPVQCQIRRHRFEGVLQIVRYNWPRYMAGSSAALVPGAWLWCSRNDGWLRFALWLAVLLAAWWCLASLVASFWIYDQSKLYRWTWIPSVLPAKPGHWLNLHAGLDESSAALRELFPDSTGRTCDFYDAAEMSEFSIRRAREERHAAADERVRYRRLPFSDETFDAVFLFFAAHELRSASGREAFFRELHRVLARSGNLLLVEHARDLANFVAFGPGCLHFMAAGEWRRLARIAGLQVSQERRMSPFVRTILFRRTQ
jgi:SAM-dependent methyltransferase